MVRFLSDAWFDELARAAAALPAPGDLGESPLTVRQIVTGGSDGDLVYDLCLDVDGIRFVRPARGEPDVTFEQDRETARRLATGETHPQVELATGRLRVAGTANRLVPWAPVLDALDAALDDLRASTVW